jgi:hypothetical protein
MSTKPPATCRCELSDDAVTIGIQVVNNTIVCGRVGGHALLKAGGEIIWESLDDRPFSLDFFRIPVENDPDLGPAVDLDSWPFAEPREPDPKLTQNVTAFRGILKNEKLVAYKYYVTIGNLRLDPVIIVDE